MRKALSFPVILLNLIITFSFLNAADIREFPRPFPLVLREYPVPDGEYNPWPLDVLNIQINTDSTTQLQNEEMAAINPQNTDNAVVLWRDFRLGFRRVGVGYTFDAGMTWHDTLLVVPPYPWQSDPVLAVDSSGNYFACTLCLHSTGEGPTGIYVQKSPDGGISWSDPVIAVDSATQFFEDKQMIVLDGDSGPTYGNIYIAWTRFTADFSSSNIVLVRSIDAGQSYSNPVPVSDIDGVQWPVPAVGPDGEVYVAWFQYFPRGIVFDVSYDQGQSFELDRLIAPTSVWPGNINGDILVFPFPALACDISQDSPYRGNLYVAFMDDAGMDMDIFFIKSTDGGITWSSRVRINDDISGNGADQFHPWISIDDVGQIHAIFYDRRLDFNRNWAFDLFYSRSTDEGQSWSTNERITTISSDPGDASLAGLIGEYIGLSAWRGEIQMAWTDTRNGNQDVFSGRMQLTGVQNDELPLPMPYSLNVPYPNPFNSSTVISFITDSEMDMTLDMVDLLGRRIALLFDGTSKSGINRFTWDGRNTSGFDVASGPYFARLTGRKGMTVKKAVLLR